MLQNGSKGSEVLILNFKMIPRVPKSIPKLPQEGKNYSKTTRELKRYMLY